MLDDEEINQLKLVLKRVFALPITKSTFKEVQRGIYKTLNENVEQSNEVLEALLRGEAKEETNNFKPDFKDFVDEFSMPIRLSKDVLERGEFLNFMSSELSNQANRVIFSNFIRRLDGAEFHFFTDPEGIIQLINHFVARIEEIQRVDRSERFIKSKKEDLKTLKERLDKLLTV